MKRFLGVGLVVFALAACESDPGSLVTDTPLSETLPTPSMALVDGSAPGSGGNPHFFFLSPLVQNPIYAGVADDGVEPLVTVCKTSHGGGWDDATESCAVGAVIAEFTTTPDQFGSRIMVDPGVKYSVVWKTNDYPAQNRRSYRIAVSVLGQTLGYIDVKAYDQKTYASYQHTDEDGNVAISINGSLNITFRIEDGYLEPEFCDDTGLEDCDVQLFDYETGGTLRVLEDRGTPNEVLASEVTIPAFAAEQGNNPVQGAYAVILELEDEGVFQSGSVPTDQQVSYFIDVRTYPADITYNLGSPGVGIVLCQDEISQASIPEFFHPFLVIFKVDNEGTPNETTELLPTTYGAPACEGYNTQAQSRSEGTSWETVGSGRGLLSRLASGVARASKWLLPQPLHAYFVHGGLNTVIWDFSELGAVLNVDAPTSTAVVPPTGQVDAPTTILVETKNKQGQPFPFGGFNVQVTVTGANTATASVTDNNDGTYTATYTPANDGTDLITITLEGDEISGSPFTSGIAPLGASASGTTFSVSASEVGATTTVTIAVVNTGGAPYVFGDTYPIDVEVQVTGANTATIPAVDDDGAGNFDGTYVAQYTPSGYGTDEITVTVNGNPTGDSPQTVNTLPRPVDPAGSTAQIQSTAPVPAPGGLVDSPTNITLTVVNNSGEPYTYAAVLPIEIQIEVTGANTASPSANDNGDGTFSATYTPTVAGSDQISISIDGTAIQGSPFTSMVQPRSGEIRAVVNISGGAPAIGIPVYLYDETGEKVAEATTQVSGTDAVASFPARLFGTYTLHLPERDFDVQYDQATLTFEHSSAPTTKTFTGTTQSLPAGVAVWRVGDGGSGNAFQYVVGGRSWVSAQNQIESADPLLGVQGHMGTIASQGENDFVAGLVAQNCPNAKNEKQCKFQGWIGLTDQATEGMFAWVTGEPVTFTSWANGEPSNKNGNEDQVEINLYGEWSTENGASSNNEGYVVEWEVEWPVTPPTFPGD